MKRPIAMKCNQEQFNTVKGKLEKLGLKIKVSNGFEYFCYLCNQTVSNPIIGNYKLVDKDRIVYETWNEKIFLEACGIEVEESFLIDKQFLKAICIEIELSQESAISWIKEKFSKAFEEEKKELVVGTWYNYNGALLNYQGVINNKYPNLRAYGIVPTNGGWTNESNFGSNPEEWTEAVESDVFEALTAEAINRGYLGNYFESVQLKDISYCSNSMFSFCHGILYSNGNSVFCAGKWAKIIPTISKQEAEKQLGKKII